jgi:acyl transferase domain-containing protein
MLAVVASIDVVRDAIAAAKLNLTVANHNGPAQVVVSGETAEIERAAELLAKRKLRTVRLPVAAAFHSPLVAAAEQAFSQALESVEFAVSNTPVFANTTGGEYPADPVAARKLLAGQLARPVEFVREIESLYAAGVRTFVEVGPQAKLSGLVRSILGDRSHTALAIDASSGRRSGQFDLACAIAELAVLGRAENLAHWDPIPPAEAADANAKKKPGLIVPLSGANYVKPRAARPPRVQAEMREPGVGSQEVAASAGPVHAASPKTIAPPRPVVSSRPGASAVRQTTMGTSAVRPAPGPVPQSRPVRSLPPDHSQNQSSPVRQPTVTPTAIRSNMELDQALRLNEQSILSLERMQEQTAQLHRQYLEGQLVAQRTVEQLIEQQQWLLGAALGAPTAAAAPLPTLMPAVVAAPQPAPVYSPAPQPRAVAPAAVPVAKPVISPSSQRQPAPPIAAAAAPVAAPIAASTPRVTVPSVSSVVKQPAPLPAASGPDMASVLLEIVADKTGYPVETLDLEMSLDADLGIDSIKRVEIMSAVQERMPDAPPVKPDDLGRLQTLRQIVNFLAANSTVAVSANTAAATVTVPQPSALAAAPGAATPGAATPATASPPVSTGPSLGGPSSDELARTLLEVVADKTGYPAETLELDMSLDADLGIDSIKRVEILSALQERMPDAPPVKPDDLGRLQTLRQIVAFLNASSLTIGAAANPTLPAAPSSGAALPVNTGVPLNNLSQHNQPSKDQPSKDRSPSKLPQNKLLPSVPCAKTRQRTFCRPIRRWVI